MNRLLVAHTPLGEAWWVLRLQGREELSSLYEFRLELKSDDPDIDIQSMIGEVCAVECQANSSITRYFSGLIVGAMAKGETNNRHWLYELQIAPKLWFASRRADFKIYQNLTIQAITDEVLQQNAINYEWRLKNSYKTWEYVVQYGETDLAFLLRLFGHEGIYFWFEHSKDGEKLILGDHFSVHDPFGGYETIPYYPPSASRVDEDHFNAWYASRIAEPGKFVHTNYDFKSPSKDLKAQSTDPRGHLFDQYEVFAYPGTYNAPEQQHGQEYAAARLQGLQIDQNVVVLEGIARGAIPGCRFSLEKHPVQSQNREFLITKAEYSAQNNDYESNSNVPSEGASFHAKISAMPADRQYRAPRESFEMPRTHGPDTAVVVGPAGTEIHTDEYGRVKVHFHWDRYGKKDGKDSCWIRVAHQWAGSNFGSIHIPRIGQEVIVDYEHGNPERPIITGRVYNASQMPPWNLPANKTQSGILTRSSLQGAYSNANALRFEDAKGQEQVWLHAERNQDIEVEVDETHWVGQDRTKTIDRDETTTVHRNRTETVDGNETITIHQNRTETVDQDETITIHQNRTETVDQDETITIHQNRSRRVDKNETVSIGKSRKKTVNIMETNFTGIAKVDAVGAVNLDNVGATRMTNIGAAYSLNVGGLMNTFVAKKQATQVGGSKTLMVGKTYKVVTNDTILHGKKTVVLSAGKTFEISCGSSKIVMTSSGISFQSPKINLLAIAGINADAGLIQLNAGAARAESGASSAKVEDEKAPPVKLPQMGSGKLAKLKAAAGAVVGAVNMATGVATTVTGIASTATGIANTVMTMAGVDVKAPAPAGSASPLDDPGMQAIASLAPALAMVLA